MADNDDLGLTNLKFLLLYFEALPGLKINLSKSEVLVLVCSPDAISVLQIFSIVSSILSLSNFWASLFPPSSSSLSILLLLS